MRFPVGGFFRPGRGVLSPFGLIHEGSYAAAVIIDDNLGALIYELFLRLEIVPEHSPVPVPCGRQTVETSPNPRHL